MPNNPDEPEKDKIHFPEYPKIHIFILLLFCGYVLTWYLQLGFREPALGDMRFEFIYAACLSVFAIYFLNKFEFFCPLITFICLYFIVLFVQVIFSYTFDYSWKVFVDKIVKYAFMALFIVAFVKSPNGLTLFLVAFMLACMKMGQEGLVGQIGGSLVWQNQGVMRLHGSTPMYMHPNSFSGMAIGTLPFIYYLFPISSKIIKGALLMQLAFVINIIIFTGSRTGYVAFCAFLLFVFVKSKYKIKTLIYGLCAVSILFLCIPRDYQERFFSIYTLKEKEGRSSEKRIIILKDAWTIFLKHPFGVGVAAFPFVREKMYGRSQDTHNLYLEVLTNLGIHGFIIFFLLVFKALMLMHGLSKEFSAQINSLNEKLDDNNLSHYVRSEIVKHASDLKLFYATINALFLFICLRLVLGIFGMDLYEIYWWFAFGLTISISKMNTIARKKTDAFNESPFVANGVLPPTEELKIPI